MGFKNFDDDKSDSKGASPSLTLSQIASMVCTSKYS
jgi:hypothetical protein